MSYGEFTINLLWHTAGHSRRQAGLTILHRELATLQLVYPRQGSKMQLRGSQCLGEHQTAQTSCLQSAVCPSVWWLLPCATQGLCCWAALAEKAPMAGEVAGIWVSPPRCQRQGQPEAGGNKWAARDRVSYQADIKRLLTECPWTSVCCVIAIYRNMLSGTLLKCVCIWFCWLLCFLAQVCSMSSPNSVEVLDITWKPISVSVLMDGLSLTLC